MASQITALMVAFLLHLQSEDQLNLIHAKKLLQSNSLREKNSLIFQWLDWRKWDLHIYMQEALEQFIHLQQQIKVQSYARSIDYYMANKDKNADSIANQNKN